MVRGRPQPMFIAPSQEPAPSLFRIVAFRVPA